MVLIDTHIFIWMIFDVDKLSENEMSVVTSNDLCLSIASLWEMSIKKTLKRITFVDTIPELAAKCSMQGIEIIPIKPEHCERIQKLPLYHRDSFDRIIIAQSFEEGCPLLTRDQNIIKGYPEADIIW